MHGWLLPGPWALAASANCVHGAKKQQENARRAAAVDIVAAAEE